MSERKLFSKKNLILFGISLLLVLSGFFYYRYWYVYSEGTRVGILYKFSKKGTMFKTYEGEMVLPGIKFKQQNSGVSSNMFFFSVQDEELAKKLMSSQGMELELHYLQYNSGLPWRGETYEGQDGQYVVDALTRVKNENPNGYGL